ncbi:MAG: alpha/beta fold hydrolase, partial [Candidatus Binatia bacterium]
MARLAANGVELVYEEIGAGAPLLFVSATGCDRTVWGAQVAHFMGRYRCISFDNRDVGESTIVSTGYGPRDMAADAAALMAALELPPTHVVGHSLGGAIAQELALAVPARVRSLTLVGTWARNDEYTRALFRTWKQARTHFGRREFVESMLLTALGHTFLNAVGTETLVDMFLATSHPQPPEAYCRHVDADLAHETAGRLGQIAAPTLVVAGEDDMIFPRHHHRMLAEGIPGASL